MRAIALKICEGWFYRMKFVFCLIFLCISLFNIATKRAIHTKIPQTSNNRFGQLLSSTSTLSYIETSNWNDFSICHPIQSSCQNQLLPVLRDFQMSGFKYLYWLCLHKYYIRIFNFIDYLWRWKVFLPSASH